MAMAILLLTGSASAQSRTQVWYLDQGGGIDFRYEPPRQFAGHAMTGKEWGCSQHSDALGNVLAYSNGSTVWNGAHQVMRNGGGLSGNAYVNKHPALFVPYPGRPDLCYLFTTDGFSRKEAASTAPYNEGLRYHLIDLHADGGRGAVVLKNRLLFKPTSMKLAGVQATDCGYWVIGHPFNSAEYRVYHVTAAGLDFEVFNRWGQRVFASDQPLVPWDGGRLPVGVYFYSVRGRNCQSEPLLHKGTVTLMR